jgi:hypothetical protein
MPVLTRNIVHDGTQFTLTLDTEQDLSAQVETQALETLNQHGKTVNRIGKRFMVNALVSRVQRDFDQLRSAPEEAAHAQLTGASSQTTPPLAPAPSSPATAATASAPRPVAQKPPSQAPLFPFTGKINTLDLRGGTTSRALLPTGNARPFFGGEWSPHLQPGTESLAHLQCRVAEDVLEGPLVQSGTIKPDIVPWRDGDGFTLLVDICHAAEAGGAHPFETGTEWVRLDIDISGRPLTIQYPSREQPHRDKWGQGSNNMPGLDCLVPTTFRTQVAIPFNQQALLDKYPTLSDADSISVVPRFGSLEAPTFHSNSPHTVQLPQGMFNQAGKLRRMEWDEVPTNGYGKLTNVISPFLDLSAPEDQRPNVVTAMETEAEFTLAGAPKDTEQTLMGLITTIDSMTQTGAEDAKAQAALREFLGPDLCDGCDWHIERKARKYDVLDATGGEVAAPKGYDISPPRAALQQRGLGRPGILVDSYVHVGPEGVIRQRDNFAKEGIVAVKGGYKREGPFMVRYNRQVECNKELPIRDNMLAREDELENLLYSDSVNFQDCLFHQPGSDPTPPATPPPLNPVFQVKSERYRYLFVRKQTGGHDNRPVMIELSFDISTGQALDPSGNTTGTTATTVGFEFGLDHLGASAARQVQAEGGVPAEHGSASHPEVEQDTLQGPVAHRTWHDREDLNHPSLFTRPAFTIFRDLVTAVTPRLCKDIPLHVAGEKALTMLASLDSPTAAQAPGHSATQIFQHSAPAPQEGGSR